MNTIPNIEGNKKLRTPQVEAYLKIQEYFLQNEQGEALVVLPTGTGKSGLISIAPFGICKIRTLVITPGIVTKNSVLKTLHPLDDNFWINYDVVFNAEDVPAVEEYSSDMLDSSLNSLDVVITNVHQLNEQNRNSLLNRVDPDFFDFVIVDEAHHSVADSWKKALEFFSGAKKLHVTGTPYRGDQQELPGEEIHNTPLSEVMALKYVKGLRKKTISSDNLFFIMPETGNKVTKEQALLLKESEWIEKSVALSEECSKQVIDETINQLAEIKNISNDVPHKILAVACNISHAKDLKKWYEEKGKTAVIVHSRMKSADLDKAFRSIENHECEVVVSVNMLMEGYDHIYLTVLGIFRPYRSQNAFAQIIGRVLRAIPDKEIVNFDIDNNACVVFHKEVGLDEMWEDFASEVVRSKNIPIERTISDREYEKRTTLYADLDMGDSFIAEEDSYLTTVDFNELFEIARQDIINKETKNESMLRASGFNEEEIQTALEALRKKEIRIKSDEIDQLLQAKRPEQVRNQIREILVKVAREEAVLLLEENNLTEKGTEIAPIFKRYMPYLERTAANDEVLVRYINLKLSRKFGPVKERENHALLESQKYLSNTLVPEIRRMLANGEYKTN